MARSYRSSEHLEAPWPQGTEDWRKLAWLWFSPAGRKNAPAKAPVPVDDAGDPRPVEGPELHPIEPQPPEAEGADDADDVLHEIEPGFRPPRDEEICLPLPGDAPGLPTADPIAAATPPKEVWLYASGGGLRSPQAALGAAWYLDREDHWKYVTRMVSVSGGALTNAEFAARARHGAAQNAPGSPSRLLPSFHRRLSQAHRWALWLLVAVLAALAIPTVWAVWRAPAYSDALVSYTWFRWTLAALAVAALLLGLWLLSGKNLGKFALFVVAAAVVIGAGVLLVKAWSMMPGWLQLVVGLVIVAVVLLVLWLVTRPDFWRWLSVVVALAAGVALIWYFLDVRDAKTEWLWLEWLVTLVMIVLLVLAYLGAFQWGIRWWLQFRVRRMLHADGSEPEQLGDIESGLAHIFSTADFGSGHPLYLSAGPVIAGSGDPTAVAVHDMSSPSNALHYYDANAVGTRAAVYASAALPALVLLDRRRLDRAFDPDDEPDVNPVPGVWYFGQEDLDHPPDRAFALMDGGLNSTLGTRLDPLLAGLIDHRGTMEAFDILYPPANPFGASNDEVRRVAVDAGQYLDETALTRFASWAGISAIATLKRGVNIANLSLLESDRQLADRPGTDIWYLPTTGGDRTFQLRFTAASVAALGGPATAPGELRDAVLAHGRLTWALGVVPPPLIPIAQGIDRVLLLKERSDRLSLTSGVAEYGYDAMASGVASAFVEHKGIDVDLFDLEKCLFELDELILERPEGAASRIRFNTRLPLAVSHQGLRPAGARGNTAEAFFDAMDAGFTMLEVDVMRTSDDHTPGIPHLAAVHAADPGAPGDPRPESSAEARGRTFNQWSNQIDHLAHLRQLLDPLTYRDELFTFAAHPDNADVAVRQAKADRLATAVWNIEAKDRRTALAVADLLDDLPPAVRERVFFSGGWLIRPLRAFRARHPDVMTACHWWEGLRLAFGFRAPKPHVMQMPVVDPAAWWARPFVIRRLRRAARIGRAQGIAVLWFTVDHAAEAILLRSVVPCHGFMTEGRSVLDWAKPYW